MGPALPLLTGLECSGGGAVGTNLNPIRPITLVVPFAAGGSNDVIARILAEHMAKTLGQAIAIENDGGAGGTTASRRVAQAAADGYTIMLGNMGTHGAAPAHYPNLKYDPTND